MRRQVGLDINGWHDFACRNWRAEEPDERSPEPVLVDGGVRSVVVRSGKDIIGGPQAIVSPIGRGAGWGPIGAVTDRRLLHDVLNALATSLGEGDVNAADLRATIDALSRQAETILMSIPDRAEMDEARRHLLIEATKGHRRPRVTLIWRSVALVLHHLVHSDGHVVDDGMKIGCLIHSSDGWEAQRLLIRRLQAYPDHLIPERESPGSVIGSTLGLSALLDQAEEMVRHHNPQLGAWSTDKPRLAVDLLCSDPAPVEEILRQDKGSWIQIQAPGLLTLPRPSAEALPTMTGCDRIIVLSPLSSLHQDWLRDCLSAVATDIVMAPAGAAARGALIAADRIERGIPHYLERLDQIAVAVLKDGSPYFHDLVPRDAAVPGNREYVSELITNLAWPATMATAKFYIRKGDEGIRSWTTPQVTPPDRNQALEVRLRQMPAQGWATVTVSAPDWEDLRRDPLRMDWATLQPDPRSEREILTELELPRPVVPVRVRYLPHRLPWDGTSAFEGLADILRRIDPATAGGLAILAEAVSRSWNAGAGEWVSPVGTDGDLPEDLDPKTKQRFEQAVNTISSALLQELKAGRSPTDNRALQFLTWTFARCPSRIQSALLDAMAASERSEPHPLLRPRGAGVVIVHGIGRTITDEERLLSLIPRLSEDLSRPNYLAALSSVLSRPAATPSVLRQLDITRIGSRLGRRLKTLVDEERFGRDLKYVLLAIGGLIRIREYEPWAFLDMDAKTRDVSTVLRRELRHVSDYLMTRAGSVRGGAFKAHIANELIELLAGTGGRPQVLIVVDASTEEQ